MSILKRVPLLTLIAATGLVGLVLTGSASGASGICGKYRFDEVNHGAVVEQSAGFPFALGSWNVLAVLSDSHRTFVRSGKVQQVQGAQKFFNTVSNVQLMTLSVTLATSGIGYFPDGTVSKVQTDTATVQPDGSVRHAGEGHFTGGSGRRRGTTGHYTFTGSQASPTAPLVAQVHGVGKYSSRRCK